MATFVLVHGGGHGGWCYQPVARILRTAGHDVYTPTLTGVGERVHLRDAQVDLETHVVDVANVLRFEGLTDVILAGHSYGGMVITGVADRAGDRIGTLVYLDAAHPANGQSLVDVAGPHMQMARDHAEIVDGVEVVLNPAPGVGVIYGVEDPEVLAWMDDKLTGHPWRCFEQKLHLDDEAAVRAIRRVNINTTENLRNSPPDKRARQLDGDVNHEIGTGHDLMLTEPDALAALLLTLT
jgi:pimeloyl-ACP methyl ester carboxylesterase